MQATIKLGFMLGLFLFNGNELEVRVGNVRSFDSFVCSLHIVDVIVHVQQCFIHNTGFFTQFSNRSSNNVQLNFQLETLVDFLFT
ncbi:hypothetical protein D3C71_1613820 [compost metagenome]